MKDVGLKTLQKVGLFLAVAVFCVAPVGCGGSQRQSASQEQSNLKPLVILYGHCKGQNRGEPPASEAALKQFIQSLSAEELARWGVTDVDSLFTSPRDGKPYVILYGDAAKSGAAGPGYPQVVAYEQEGVGGKRLVGSSPGDMVEEVDEARFKELVPDAN